MPKNWLATGRLPELHETGGLFDVEFIDEEPVLIGQPGPGRSYFQSNFPQLIIPDDLPETGWYNREKEPREHYPVRLEIVNRLLSEHGGTDHRRDRHAWRNFRPHPHRILKSRLNITGSR